MISLSLSHLADVLGGRLVVRGDDTPDTLVSGLVDTDSRLIGPGGIFVAKPGETTDGHLFVGTAVERGAALAIVERELDDAVSQIVVPDAVAALSDLARDVVARVRDAGPLQIVGITGSNGKTTTKNLLARILEDEGETVAPRASFNNEVGAPLTMLRVTENTRYLVSEFGASAPGAIAHLAGLVTPDVGVVLMVGMAHAGGFGGIESTFHAKSELVKATREGGLAVLNADDPRVAAMEPIARERGQEVRWFGRGERAEVRALDVEVSASGTRADLLVDGEPFTLTLRVLGEHHVMNALAALAAATALGVAAADAIARLETVEIAERWRMQPLGSDRVRIINDAYNASPDSMAAALRTLAQITGPEERTVAVLGAMSELGEYADEEHDRVGLLAVRLRIQRIVVIGPEARRMYLEAIAQGSWDGEAVFFADADAAYDYLSTELRDGDRVLVKSSNSAGLRHLGDRLGDLFA
ncbi:UDP-N-acetylmuramoyl-tripeptide--D-alanyl-D-alanine ligase [Microbacterium testaceum]|uniref:UDP-N-acetylmuramoyl-tripeptide--D-alanyl-D-alanine ligase n=1 Tax=Microbacterium testaceum TaxID=2033 RepID=A0A4Y3QI20_MICTE|nr:UDP-N-acetylmuramoyl-tripeptide--D-alanyl-D-alanine ligase [Microbacterium testaceum]PNW08151.1 UDP-N-acetylmuramoylalanyl-D-glutamate--2,6-diaminopimelate ligase [Microbacterium testaceum]GEB44802.1 UDP-N-acetylmuramoyl-tripeptide--D-alanyl-D-alanine ligase [Microbacterium testaceum]